MSIDPVMEVIRQENKKRREINRSYKKTVEYMREHKRKKIAEKKRQEAPRA